MNRNAIDQVPEIKDEIINEWLTTIYDPEFATDDILKGMRENFMYKGFNRSDIVKQLFAAVQDKELVIQLIVATALRGPSAASKLKLANGKTSIEMGISASGGKGTKKLTLNKILSATADLAAFYLKKLKFTPRVMSELPAWLQFPSAGSIRLPEKYRILHIEFSRKFSPLIGGVFQEQIYIQMEQNAYLDPRLRLFD